MTSEPKLKAIVYTPVGEEIEEDEISREDALNMIDCLQQLHSIGVLHRNLVPGHFLRCPLTKKLFLIGFGSIFFIDESSRKELCTIRHDNKCDEHQGTINFAPIDVLEHFVGKR